MSTIRRGVIEYRGDSGLRGQEWWSVTTEEDGSRTLASQCRMFDTRVERWVVHSVDARMRPKSSFVSHRKAGEHLGEGRFWFEPGVLRCHSQVRGLGEIEQRREIDGELDYFVPHAVAGDSWITPCYDHVVGGVQEIRNGFASSLLPDGSTGPLIEQHVGIRIRLAGIETVAVPAGTFETSHFVVSTRPGVDEHLWVTRDAFHMLVKLRSDRLATTYLLTELDELPAWPTDPN
jgi:hypothetical protein